MRVILEGLSHAFAGNPELFTGLDAELLPGHRYALTGPSGSGKSTLLAILAGWVAPTGGRVVREEIERVSWVFQNPHGVAGRTAVDHVALPLLARGMRRPAANERARELLAEVHLDAVADRPFSTLSGGEAQRLMLARALAGEPSLLLVDEPTAQLDQRTAASVDAALAAVASPRTIIVVATHDPRTRDSCTDVLDLTAARAR